MKQTAQKKPKVFRTLILRIHIGGKAVRDNSNESAAREKSEKQERRSSFFFGR